MYLRGMCWQVKHSASQKHTLQAKLQEENLEQDPFLSQRGALFGSRRHQTVALLPSAKAMQKQWWCQLRVLRFSGFNSTLSKYFMNFHKFS